MNSRLHTLRSERGIALPLALFALVMLSGLLLAFMTMSGMEPEIASNLNEVSRARYVAEAGIEWAFDQLATNPNWSGVLATNGGTMTPAGGQALPGLANAFGTFTATVRNDNQAGDPQITGLPTVDGGVVGGNPTTDTNGAVILTAGGTYQGVTRQIQVVLRRVQLPPFPGAYSMPGVQADLAFPNANFDIDGRDWICQSNCNDPDPGNRVYGMKADQSKMKFGIGVQPGVQSNLLPATTYEQRAEGQLNTAQKQANVQGMNQNIPGTATAGLATVAAPANPNDVLDTGKMQTFLDALAQFRGTTIYQSNLACSVNIGGTPVGLSMTGNAAQPTKPTLTNGCGLNQQLDLGDRNNPKLLYFRGDLDPTSTFAGLRTTGSKIRGAGILIVEDGDFRITNQFDWDGIIIVTGKYVSSIFESGSKTSIYGATVSNETVPCEGGCPNLSTYWDGYFATSNTTRLRFSQEALDIVQRKLLFRMSTWREL